MEEKTFFNLLARAAGTYTSGPVDNVLRAVGLLIKVEITALSGAGLISLIELQVLSPSTQTPVTILQTPSLAGICNATGNYVFLIHPNDSMSAGAWSSTPLVCPLPRRFQLKITTTGTSITAMVNGEFLY